MSGNVMPGVALATKVEFLRQPGSYPDHPSQVETIETHKSWVFLTDRFVYKLKKPIRYNSVDFQPVDARCHYCAEEVRLNRRLAGDVYIGVSKLTVDANGLLALDGAGRLVECLVQMHRLPATCLLINQIHAGSVDPAAIEQLAIRLARFYKSAPPETVTGARYRAHLEREIRLNGEALALPRDGLFNEFVPTLQRLQLQILASRAEAFDERVRRGHVVEGHGDLRLEHICLSEPPVIFDCLEFDRQLRIVDAVDELSFLALESERIGADWIGQTVLDRYRQLTKDRPESWIEDFYKSYRAAMWARLAIWRTMELDKHLWTRWIARANEYLRLATHYGECL